MTRSWISLLALLALSGPAAAQDGAEVDPMVDLVRIDKSDRTLTLYAQGRAVRTYSGIPRHRSIIIDTRRSWPGRPFVV